MRVVALEEHYWDAEVAASANFGGAEGRDPKIRARLDDLGDLRIAEMDAAGIDLQVISHGAPSTQRLDGESAIRLARGANDRLHKAVQHHPDRFAAFAALPTPDPAGAADELERAVTKLGFKGAMVHGLTNGIFFDDKQFWPIFERAQALDVPLYVHPAVPHPAVVEAYYKDYVGEFPSFLTAAWGFTMETATHGIRLVLSGVLDAYPDVKIILGHMGEGLPFLLWRINYTLQRPGNRKVDFRELFTRNFYITTSGNFSTPALQCAISEMGIDHVLFSVDYPFVENPPGTTWINEVQMAASDKEKILHGNAERILHL
jgi:predicted TIM-barrel fold metal-dependent hydrolase